MARPALIEDEELLRRLSVVFRDVGFSGASLATLSEATGLKRASLYHRFPDGKEQMAREVLDAAAAWLEENILSPLRSDAPPRDRLKDVARRLSAFYSGGKQACLLNMLSSARIQEGPFTKQIKTTFESLIKALVTVAVDAGIDEQDARLRAERVVMMLQGSLVLSRGMGTTRPFRNFLERLPSELIGDESHRSAIAKI